MCRDYAAVREGNTRVPVVGRVGRCGRARARAARDESAEFGNSRHTRDRPTFGDAGARHQGARLGSGGSVDAYAQDDRGAETSEARHTSIGRADTDDVTGYGTPEYNGAEYDGADHLAGGFLTVAGSRRRGSASHDRIASGDKRACSRLGLSRFAASMRSRMAALRRRRRAGEPMNHSRRLQATAGGELRCSTVGEVGMGRWLGATRRRTPIRVQARFTTPQEVSDVPAGTIDQAELAAC